jgi:hypothetical protein
MFCDKRVLFRVFDGFFCQVDILVRPIEMLCPQHFHFDYAGDSGCLEPRKVSFESRGGAIKRKMRRGMSLSFILFFVVVMNVFWLCWTNPSHAAWTSSGPDGYYQGATAIRGRS